MTNFEFRIADFEFRIANRNCEFRIADCELRISLGLLLLAYLWTCEPRMKRNSKPQAAVRSKINHGNYTQRHPLRRQYATEATGLCLDCDNHAGAWYRR